MIDLFASEPGIRLAGSLAVTMTEERALDACSPAGRWGGGRGDQMMETRRREEVITSRSTCAVIWLAAGRGLEVPPSPWASPFRRGQSVSLRQRRRRRRFAHRMLKVMTSQRRYRLSHRDARTGVNGVVTSTTRLRFDRHSTAYEKS